MESIFTRRSIRKYQDKSIEKEFITHDCKELYSVFDNKEEMLEYLENYDEKDVDISKVKIR